MNQQTNIIITETSFGYTGVNIKFPSNCTYDNTLIPQITYTGVWNIQLYHIKHIMINYQQKKKKNERDTLYNIFWYFIQVM